MHNTKILINQVRGTEHDHEFYPTTKAMLEVVAKDIQVERNQYRSSDNFKILDIGAGDGNALKTICELTDNKGQKYAIEKSRPLIDSLPADIFIVGTDFHQQTLIDKEVDVIFCNPPYSEYETWAKKIITEANCSLIYLIIPQRWKENKELVAMINQRCEIKEDDGSDLPEFIKKTWDREKGLFCVLGSDTFEDSEFRQARANVDILKIKLRDNNRGTGRPSTDPFSIWFDNEFKIQADKSNADPTRSREQQAQKIHELVQGQNVIERLESLYQKDMTELLDVYRSLEKIDKELFRELGVNLEQVKGGLRQKIAGLKNLYWKELFSNLDTITDRLTSKSRKAMLDKMFAHTSIDFTWSNGYAVIMWAIKNANQYFDQQLTEVYYDMTDQENIKNYKSNTRILNDKWRYGRNDFTHYTLDYRLVLNRRFCFSNDTYRKYDFPNGLHSSAHEFLGDICTIAENLGFNVVTNSLSLQWEPGKKQEFFLNDGTLFMDVRAYMKGTIHIRLNQDFMRKLNVEAARINGWVKSPEEFTIETGEMYVSSLFGANYQLKSLKLLEG